MVLFRLLQGVFGAALVPLSQAVMLDSYALHERGQGDGDLGHGRDDGPDHGPVARRLADRQSYSWHWVFFDQPAVRRRHRARPDGCSWTRPSKNAELRFDWFGFVALAVGIGSLQIALDRGEQLGWFGSSEISPR